MQRKVTPTTQCKPLDFHATRNSSVTTQLISPCKIPHDEVSQVSHTLEHQHTYVLRHACFKRCGQKRIQPKISPQCNVLYYIVQLRCVTECCPIIPSTLHHTVYNIVLADQHTVNPEL